MSKRLYQLLENSDNTPQNYELFAEENKESMDRYTENGLVTSYWVILESLVSGHFTCGPSISGTVHLNAVVQCFLEVLQLPKASTFQEISLPLITVSHDTNQVNDQSGQVARKAVILLGDIKCLDYNFVNCILMIVL